MPLTPCCHTTIVSARLRKITRKELADQIRPTFSRTDIAIIASRSSSGPLPGGFGLTAAYRMAITYRVKSLEGNLARKWWL